LGGGTARGTHEHSNRVRRWERKPGQKKKKNWGKIDVPIFSKMGKIKRGIWGKKKGYY